MMLDKISPKLKIHCWGGLGFQLLALSFYLIVKAKLPSRKIQLVLHSGGVTKRESEIDFLRDQINIVTIDDFAKNQNIYANSSLIVKFSKYFKKQLKFFLNSFNVVINDENKVLRIMPWTTNIRCTYSKINLNVDIIKKLAILLKFEPNIVNQDFIGVQFRAGDLSILKQDNLIPLKAIVDQIENLNLDLIKPKRVVFYSDSDLELEEFETRSNSKFEFKKTNTLNTIFELSSSKIFIGTNSKVSLWVALLKYGFEIPGLILLPNTMINSFYSFINPFEPINNFILETYSY